jgi:hypothetical protein
VLSAPARIVIVVEIDAPSDPPMSLTIPTIVRFAADQLGLGRDAGKVPSWP